MAKKKDQISYGAKDIETMESDMDIVRNRPSIFMPTNKPYDVLHIIREIKDNMDDEASACSERYFPGCKTVYADYNISNRMFTAWDYGRGIPDVQRSVEVLWTSGKYNKSVTSAYNIAGGMNGVGYKLALYLSEYFFVEARCHDTKVVTTLEYHEGVLSKRTDRKLEKGEKTGTIVKFIPSEKFLAGASVKMDALVENMISEKAEAFDGIDTILTIRNDKKVIKERHIKGLSIHELVDKYYSIKTSLYCVQDSLEYVSEKDNERKTMEIDVIFGYDTDATDNSVGGIRGYCNYIYNPNGGSHVDAVIDAMSDFIRKPNSGILNEKDRMNVRLDDIRLGLSGVIIVRASEADFSTQAKVSLDMPRIKEFAKRAILQYMRNLPQTEKKAIADTIKRNVKVRLAAEGARKKVKPVSSSISKDRIEKYTRVSSSYSGDIKTLFIVEGDSAAGQVITSKFDYQEVLSLRGKIDNIIKELADPHDNVPVSKLNKYQIVNDLSRILGIPIGCTDNSIKPVHDYVFTLTDADPDGGAIASSLVVLVWYAFRPLIMQGRLRIISPPAYSFIDKHNRTVFVSSDREYYEKMVEYYSEDNQFYRDKGAALPSTNTKPTKVTNREIVEAIGNHDRYNYLLDRLAGFMCGENRLVEVITWCVKCFANQSHGKAKNSPVNDTAPTKLSKLDMSLLSKLLQTVIPHYYPCHDLVVEHKDKDGYIIIEGLTPESITFVLFVNDSLLNNHRFIEFYEDMDIYNTVGFYVTPKKGGNGELESVTMGDILHRVDSYKCRAKERYKGLGQMSEESLRDTCADLENANVTVVTVEDVDRVKQTMFNWYSKKSTEYRKDFLRKYKFDFLDIDT